MLHDTQKIDFVFKNHSFLILFMSKYTQTRIFYRNAIFFILMICLFFIPIKGFSREFPDKGGVLDFSKPEKISDQLFVLTNPKSGSHLLLYSIMKLTQRPLRGRVLPWYFENDPPFFSPENLMDYPLNFSKPTFYWGHEYFTLRHLNHSQNKLIFILRNYKENISSQLMLKNKNNMNILDLNELILNEVLNEGTIFKEYMIRLETFDSWDSNHRCLVLFDNLISHPEIFVPQVLNFIGDNTDYLFFVDHYEDFKKELIEKYNGKKNRTGSGEDKKFFSKKILLKTHRNLDDYVQKNYPIFWESYLKRYEEKNDID